MTRPQPTRTRGKRMLAAALQQVSDASQRCPPVTPPDKIRKPARSPPQLRRATRLCFSSSLSS